MNPVSILTAVVSGLELLVFPRDIQLRQIDWLRWIISKQRSTPALITLSHNCFSIIATFSIFGNGAHSRAFTSQLSPELCQLHQLTGSNAWLIWLEAPVFLRSFYVPSSLAKMIPRRSAGLAFNTRWINAMISLLIMSPVFISTRSTGP